MEEKHLCQILKLSIENFRSFNDRQDIYFSDDEKNANPVTVLIGANGSGKSNLTKAVSCMFNYIIMSLSPNFTPPYNPFAFSRKTINSPTFFEVTFKYGADYYMYGFSYNQTNIIEEYLLEKNNPSKKYHTVFHRTNTNELNTRAANYGFGKKLLSETRRETLLITKAREENNKYSNIVFNLVQSTSILCGMPQELKSIAINIMQKNSNIKESLKEYLKRADFAVMDFSIRHLDMPEDILKQLPVDDKSREIFRKDGLWSINTLHRFRDDEKNEIEKIALDIDDESTGTQEFFYTMALVIDTIQKGNTLYIDEFASSLHPDLAQAVIEIFKNDNNGKLIINTHVQQLLSAPSIAKNPGRIILVEKKHIDESTKITPLKKRMRRQDEVISVRYNKKLYGGVPDLQNFDGAL